VSAVDRSERMLFAKGRGSVVFGEFVGTGGESLGMASIFTSERTADGMQTAVCLFGRMTNFADYLPEGELSRRGGWTSSAAPYIKEFIETECRTGVSFMTREQLAGAALDVSLKQGMHQSGAQGQLPWNREFTYGDVQDEAQWCAQIYYDVLVGESNEYVDSWEGYHRVLIGAPLWVRTPRLRALRIYDEYDSQDLDREAGFGVVSTQEDSTQAQPGPRGQYMLVSGEPRDMDCVDGTPWPKRLASWLIDLVIASAASIIVGRAAATLLDWPNFVGWIFATVLAFSYWPIMRLLGRTPGQLVMAVRPASSAHRPTR
jgi:hypothetical protein